MWQLTRFGGKHSKTVVPEAAGNQKTAVDGGHKAIGANFQHLAKVVAQVTTTDRIAVVVGAVHSCNGRCS